MLCQRCGLCCFTMGVTVMLDTPKGLVGAWKPDGVACPHMSFEEGLACCAVHARPEYKDSPCWVYGNPDVDPDFAPKRGQPCQVGLAVLKWGGLRKVHPGVLQAALPLKILGPWPKS